MKSINQIDDKIKKCRVKEVIALSDKNELDFYDQKIGNTYDGIIETRKDGKRMVITSNYIPVMIDTKLENNTKVRIKINSIENNIVVGEII